MAKRVRDVAGGVSQCGEQRSTEAKRSPEQPDRQGTPKKFNAIVLDSLAKME
ncbi:MAG: hypothetical protein JNM36_00215 [Chitinophagales bacterium]|nr:hypothetical protein [Chitinophagales bacterium]